MNRLNKKHKLSWIRLAIGVMLTPLIPVLIYTLNGLVAGTIANKSVSALFDMALFSYFAALMLGYPAYLFISNMNWFSLRAFVTSGLFLGILAYSAGIPDNYFDTLGLQEIKKFIFYCLSGTIAGFVFWVLVIRKPAQ